MKDIEIMIVEEFIKDVKNLSDEEQFTIFGSSEMTIREPIENLLKSYKENTSELETYKKMVELMSNEILILDIRRAENTYDKARIWETEKGIIKYFRREAEKCL